MDPRAVSEYRAGLQALSRGGPRAEERALEHFRAATRLDPNLWEAHHDAGVLLRRRGDLREAIAAFERASRIQPAATEPLLALAEARLAVGDLRGAAEALAAHVERNPDDADVRLAYASTLRRLGELDDALEQAREVLVRNASNVRALLEVGRIYRARRQWDVAALVFRKALDLARSASTASTPNATRPPSQPDTRLVATIHEELGLLELGRGDTQAAFVELGRAIEADPRHVSAHVNQGSVLLRAGDFEGAVAALRAALAIDPDDVDARTALGIALRGAGDHQGARREWERVLERAPRHAAAVFNLAILQAEFLGERRQSLERFRRFLELAGDDAPEREIAERYVREIESEGGG